MMGRVDEPLVVIHRGRYVGNEKTPQTARLHGGSVLTVVVEPAWLPSALGLASL